LLIKQTSVSPAVEHKLLDVCVEHGGHFKVILVLLNDGCSGGIEGIVVVEPIGPRVVKVFRVGPLSEDVQCVKIKEIQTQEVLSQGLWFLWLARQKRDVYIGANNYCCTTFREEAPAGCLAIANNKCWCLYFTRQAQIALTSLHLSRICIIDTSFASPMRGTAQCSCGQKCLRLLQFSSNNTTLIVCLAEPPELAELQYTRSLVKMFFTFLQLDYKTVPWINGLVPPGHLRGLEGLERLLHHLGRVRELESQIVHLARISFQVEQANLKIENKFMNATRFSTRQPFDYRLSCFAWSKSHWWFVTPDLGRIPQSVNCCVIGRNPHPDRLQGLPGGAASDGGHVVHQAQVAAARAVPTVPTAFA
jgi:hypothetical protein